jgi:hypothetical protein
MDVDRETQDLVVTNDYGIQPDFSLLEDEDKTVGRVRRRVLTNPESWRRVWP